MSDFEKMKAMAAGLAGGQVNCTDRACREMTVGENLDRNIDAAARYLKELKDLRASLPGSYLDSGGSRAGSILARLGGAV